MVIYGPGSSSITHPGGHHLTFAFCLFQSEITAKMKAGMKEKTMRDFLLSQKHIVYTEPLEVRAGTTVDVLYNPSNTVLNGKPEVWFRCSFNRWTHPSGPLPPQKMVNAENGSHLRATGVCPCWGSFF